GADSLPLQARSFDEPPCKIAVGLQEHRAAGGKLRGLIRLAALRERGQASLHTRGIVGSKRECRTQDDDRASSEGARPITKGARRAVERSANGSFIEELDGGDGFPRLVLVPSGVHDDGAAYGAGDSGGELEAGEAVLRGDVGDAGERRPRAGGE